MFPILEAQYLSPAIKRFRIGAPRIARKQQPGQFVIVRVHEAGERIPLTLADADPREGTITLIVQGIGKTTRLLNRLEAGDSLLDLVGPLGRPSEIERFGTVAVIGGGVGTAIAYPTAKALRAAGNTVVTIVGARTKDLIILEDEIRAISDSLRVCTDDGSHGEKGVVTDPLRDLIESAGPVDRVLAIGPIPMMAAVAETTRPFGIRTVVSINAVMVDGTGMCGGCRVVVNGRSQFACVDGPEFDAHQVDFGLLRQRTAMYRQAERSALERFEADPDAELARVRSIGGPDLQDNSPLVEADEGNGYHACRLLKDAEDDVRRLLADALADRE